MFFAIFTAKSDQEFAKKLRSGEVDQCFFKKFLNLQTECPANFQSRIIACIRHDW